MNVCVCVVYGEIQVFAESEEEGGEEELYRRRETVGHFLLHLSDFFALCTRKTAPLLFLF